jgi:PelA/Pel-15E family pectate lyase
VNRAVRAAIPLWFLVACLSHAANNASDFSRKDDAWFRADEGRRITSNVLSWQSRDGSWPKNIDTFNKPSASGSKEIKGTFDNGATTEELRFLARAFRVTGDVNCSNAVTRGVAHILAAQYENGGWPQYFPPPAKSYHRHITFNDNSMVRLMEFVREVAASNSFAFIPATQRAAAQGAFDRGVGCILRCQVKQADKLTAWCAQHDEKDFAPRPARAYELASISGSESVGITRLLMSIERPGNEVIRAVEAAVAWFNASKITGLRVETVNDKKLPKGKDRVVVKAADAPPLWARFYELETGRPMFCDRDGVRKYSLAEIGHERRNGYAWYGSWPASLLEKEFPAWRKRWVAGTN